MKQENVTIEETMISVATLTFRFCWTNCCVALSASSGSSLAIFRFFEGGASLLTVLLARSVRLGYLLTSS